MAKTKEVGVRLSVKDKEIAERALKEFGREGQADIQRITKAAEPATVSMRALDLAVRGVNDRVIAFSGRPTAAFTNFARGAVMALAPTLGFVAAINGAKDALDKFGSIADAAASTGLDAEFLQGVAYQAKLGGVEFDELSRALETFNKNSGLAVVNKGRMVTALKALNPELLRNIQLAQSQEERVKLVADAIAKAKTNSEAAAIATSAYGDSGQKLVAIFRGGRTAIDETAQAAREMGLIVDSELIDRADELGDKFDTVTSILDLQFKQVLIELAPLMIGTANAVIGITNAVKDFITWLSKLPAMSDFAAQTATLTDREAAVIEAQIKRKQAMLDATLAKRDGSGAPIVIGKDQGGWFGTSFGAEDGEQALRNEIAQLQQALRDRHNPAKFDVNRTFDILGGAPKPDIFGGGDEGSSSGGVAGTADRAALREAARLTERMRTAAEQYRTTLADLDAQLAKGLISQETYNRAVGDAALKRATAVKGEDDYAGALEAVSAARARGLVSEKDYTEAVVGMTRRRLEAENSWLSGLQLGLLDVSRAGDDVASDISGVVRNAVEGLGDEFADAFRTGKLSWRDLATTILGDIAKIATKQLILAPLANLLGGFFGGGGGGGWNIPTTFQPQGFFPAFPSAKGNVFATSGLSSYVNSIVTRPTVFPFAKGGAFGIMAEEKPEAVMPLGRDSSGRLGVYGSGGDVAVTYAPVYQFDGTSLTPANLRAVLEEHDREFARQVPEIVKQAARQGRI